MASLVEVPHEDICICCEREEPPRGRNEIIDEYGEKNDQIYNLVSNFFGVSFDMQNNFGCYVCNNCKMHLQNYFAAKSKLDTLIEAVNETSQVLVPDNGGNWSVSNINICIACSEKSRKKKFIVQSDANLSMRKRKQSRPPPKPGEAYKSVSDFYNLSFRTHKSCGSYVCLRCRYRLERVEEELNYKENLRRHILNSSQILKPLPDVFISLYDFDTFEEDELPFQRGDHFHELKEGEEYENWMFALNLSTGLEGYIPRLYVTRHGGELNTEVWFQDVDSKHAEEILTTPFNRKGSFLVRKTSAQHGEKAKLKHDNDISLMLHQTIVDRMQNSYVLSVLQTDPDELKPQVLHFKIQQLKNGFYRLPHVSEAFPSIPKLVEYYKGRGSGLPHRLTTPCIRVKPPVPFRGFLIKRKDISVNMNRNSKEYLGDGSVGEVYFGLQREITKVAVKKLKRQIDHKKFMTATMAISKLNHRRLVQLLGVCTESEPYLIITEYMANGPLPSFLKQHKEGTKLHFIIKTAIQITDGMKYLESQQYVHRNLRAANIMLGDRNQVKISDFGISAALLDPVDILSGNIKTFPELWTAPEALFDNNYTSKSDIWSFGILLYEMITFTSVLPYAELRKEVTDELKVKDSGDDELTITCMERIRDGYRLTQPEECPDEYYSVMLECWKEEPDERPSFAYCYHYFENYELPEVEEDEMVSTPSDSGDLTDLTAGPGYTQSLFVDKYGSFENKYKSISASRASSKIGLKNTTTSASRTGSVASLRNLSSRKPSLDFQNSGPYSGDESLTEGSAKSSELKIQSVNVMSMNKEVNSEEVNSEQMFNKTLTADGIEKHDKTLLAEQDNNDIVDRESTTILKEINSQEANKFFVTELASDFQKGINEQRVNEKKTSHDLREGRKTATPAGIGKTTSRMSKKATESRTTSVNSVAKKATKSSDNKHNHDEGTKSKAEAKRDAPTAQSTTETKETPIHPIERPVSLLQKRASIASKGEQSGTEGADIKKENNDEDFEEKEKQVIDSLKDKDSSDQILPDLSKEYEDSQKDKDIENKNSDTKETKEGIKQGDDNAIENKSDPAPVNKDDISTEKGTLENKKVKENVLEMKQENEELKDNGKNINETINKQNKTVDKKGGKSTTTGFEKSKDPTSTLAKSKEKKNAKTNKETANVKTTEETKVKQEVEEKDKEPENEIHKKANEIEDDEKSQNKDKESGNVGKEKQNGQSDIDKTVSKSDVKNVENNRENPTSKTDEENKVKHDPGDKRNGDEIEKETKPDSKIPENENKAKKEKSTTETDKENISTSSTKSKDRTMSKMSKKNEKTGSVNGSNKGSKSTGKKK